MKEIYKIIDKTLLKSLSSFFGKPKFYGNIYHIDKSGKLNIDRSLLNKIIGKVNNSYGEEMLNLNSEIYLIFHNEQYVVSDSIFTADRNHFYIVVVTSIGVLSLYSEETDGIFKTDDKGTAEMWSEIDYFEAVDNGIMIYILNSTEEYFIPAVRFGTEDKKALRILSEMLNTLNKHFSKRVESYITENINLINTIENNIKNENYEANFKLLEDFKNVVKDEDFGVDEFRFYHENKALSLKGVGKNNEALILVDEMIKRLDEEKIAIPPDTYKIKYDILKSQGKLLEALNCLAYCEENHTEIESKKNAVALKQDLYLEVKENFVDIPYQERKLIFTSQDIFNTKTNNLVLVKKDDLPRDIGFPIGHPHLNEIYTCHPLRKEFYLPLKDFQRELFIDRVSEFCYLMQCLGATKVEIISSTGNVSREMKNTKESLGVEADIKLVKGKTNTNLENKNKRDVEGLLRIDKVQTFRPTKAPYIPENLVWYKTDMNWQRLAEQRLSGNIDKHDEIIQSMQSEFVSSQEIKNINAEVQYLFVKIGGNISSDKEYEMNTKERYECKISVEFEDKNLLLDNTTISDNLELPNNQNLEKYKEDVLFMLEDDGVIDESERAILDRKIKRYGISLEDAKRIEQEVMFADFSEDEIAYIEELKDIIEDGEVTEIELKMLDRYAKKFNISAESQQKIHSVYLK